MCSETLSKQETYRQLYAALRALMQDVPYTLANQANAAALLYHSLPQVNWAGFYLAQRRATGDVLVLGPFQGKPACIEIPFGAGVCGMAAAQDAVQRVEDVHRFAGHIACDAASRSEIVLPLHRGGAVAGVLDIDSPFPARFDEQDEAGLRAVAALLERWAL